ncbi:hypothetical protein D6D13_08360 [Aureobasidium pullulans]|uniref:GPI anchored protein n=1 Tax=Aureobasidium pullulans TaxID=5580 RepID=A0A4V6TBB4_AURPU|nr:hypothetical protein D6D13_08360 [Aureobasidium pullulans]
MRFTQTFFIAAALATVGFAQDDNDNDNDSNVCDPQNDNGVTCSNGTPVSSNGVAINTNTVTNTVTDAAASTSLGSRISDLLDRHRYHLATTSLPSSLDTRTSTNLNTIVQTLESAFTTNTLGNSASTSRAVVATTTNTNTVTTGTAASGTAASSTSSGLGALQTAGKYAPFGVAVAALGFAAAL